MTRDMLTEIDPRKLDPELLDELQRNGRKELMRARRRDPDGDPTGSTVATTWQRPRFVGRWRCRTPGCTEFVDITDAVMEHYAEFNRMLRARGEATLDHSAIVWCNPCLDELRQTKPERRRREVDRMAETIRKLKATTDPTTERALIQQLREWGHPDIEGLIAALAARRSTRTARGGVHEVL